MASLTSQVALANRAMLQIGGKAAISSINPSDGSKASDACSFLFIPTYEALARSAWWDCFRAQTNLSLIAAAAGTPENINGTTLPLPPSPWLYQYLYPVTCLRARAIVPTFPAQSSGTALTTYNNAAATNIRGFGQIPFQIAYSTDSLGNPIQTILTNQSQAQLIYTVDQPNPIVWDTQFQAAFVASLAAYLVPALAMNMQQMSSQIKIAEEIIAQARASDANEGSNSQDHVPDWIQARSGGGISGYTYGYNNVGWQQMSWPSF